MRSLFTGAAILTLLLLASSSPAQSFKINGRLIDTMNNNKLPFASVVLLQAKDSLLVDYTRANSEGLFTLKTDSAGRYLLMATFPGFADYIDILNISQKQTDLGTIPMITKSHLLNEFVLKAKRGAIAIKGDTVEYAADSFYVKEGATVEDLLKKLPGLQVDKNGTITAQGEQVQKILVDGEEFFSDDPAVVTKNLQARTVESVQVFDKKSDQAALTGVDDGIREKTINLKLKENMKRGYFGKVQAGGGTKETYDNQLMLNAFKSKRKISAFGILSNTGRNGLSWEDRDRFGGGNNVEMGDDGSMFSFMDNDDGDNFSWGRQGSTNGLPRALTGGLHYSNKWQDGKHHLSSNYRGSDRSNYRTGETINQYLLSEGQGYTSTSNSVANTSNQRHRGDMRYEWKPDTSMNIKFSANAGVTFNNSDNQQQSRSIRENGDTINTGSKYTTNNSRSNSFNSSLFAVKRFKKKGRSLSVQLNQWYNGTDGEGFLRNTNFFKRNDSLAYTQIFDQRKDNNSSSLNLSGNLTYTEPISKVWFAETSYKLDANNNFSENIAYNKNGGGAYDAMDSLFSNRLQYNTTGHTPGAGIRYTDKVWNAYIGAQATFSDWKQVDEIRNRTNTRNFTNYFPQASIQYRPNQMKRVGFNYNGSTSQPSVFQISPLVQNSDPLNIAIGNPNLKQQFRHSFRLNYNDYKVMTNTWKYLNGGVTFVDDAIGRSETINAFGARTYQYINVDGNYNAFLWAGTGSKIKSWDIDYQIGINGNLGRGVNYVNNLKNLSNNYSAGVDFKFSKDKEDKYSISYSPDINYNYNKATISTVTQSFWTISQNLSIDIQLPFKIDFETEADYYWRQRTPQFPDNNNLVYWNAALVKKFLKNDDLRISLSVNDILNQNRGFNRSANDNIITQNTYNTLNRFAMLTVIWNFRWSPKGAPAEGDIQATDIIK